MGENQGGLVPSVPYQQLRVNQHTLGMQTSCCNHNTACHRNPEDEGADRPPRPEALVCSTMSRRTDGESANMVFVQTYVATPPDVPYFVRTSQPHPIRRTYIDQPCCGPRGHPLL